MDAPIATSLVTAIGGFLTPFITQAFKKWAKLSGRWPIILTAGVSTLFGLFAFGVGYLTEEVTTWKDVLSFAPWVFTTATLLYKLGMPVQITSPPLEVTQTQEQKETLT